MSRRLVGLAVAVALGGLLLFAGCGLLSRTTVAGDDEPGPQPEAIATAMRTRLEAVGLSVRAVGCLDSGIAYRGARAYRCTVNFGDPHLVPYCVALDETAPEGSVVTDRDDPTMTCYPPEEAERYRENAFGYRED